MEMGSGIRLTIGDRHPGRRFSNEVELPFGEG